MLAYVDSTHNSTTYVNYSLAVAVLDPADLVDAAEVAQVLGLSHRNSVSVYRRRYDDFPQPVVEKSRCLLWLRADVESWGRVVRRRSVLRHG